MLAMDQGDVIIRPSSKVTSLPPPPLPTLPPPPHPHFHPLSPLLILS